MHSSGAVLRCSLSIAKNAMEMFACFSVIYELILVKL